MDVKIHSFICPKYLTSFEKVVLLAQNKKLKYLNGFDFPQKKTFFIF